MNFMGGTGQRNQSTGSQRKRPNFSGDIVPKGYRTGQLQQYTPEQMQLFGQSADMLGPDSYLYKLANGDEETFNQMEAPALRQFSGLQGSIANRFSTGNGRGSTGTMRSSGFQNTQTAAASNFAQELQANRQSLQRNAHKDLMGMTNDLLNQRPYDRFLQEKQQKQPSGWGSIAGGIAGGAAGAFFGMPVQGAMAGSAFGSQF